MIGDDIKIVVLGISGCQVRFGIHAPEDTSIHRLEIYNRIQKEKEEQVRLCDIQESLTQNASQVAK